LTIRLRIFAGLAEVFGTHALELDVTAPVQLQDIRQRLLTQFPSAKPDIMQALFAVNQVYAPLDTLVREGDEVAVIPPVGGGESPSSCRISTEPLSVEEANNFLEDPYHGGTVLFCGTVREFTRQRQTLYLVYQAYDAMAVRQMRQIEEEVKVEFPETRLLQWHRVGKLLPSEIAVICGASAPHREDAFAAAHRLIHRLKQEVPIWKKEHYADGEATWQPNEEPQD